MKAQQLFSILMAERDEAPPKELRVPSNLGTMLYPYLNYNLKDPDKFVYLTEEQFDSMGLMAAYLECYGKEMDQIHFSLSWPDGSTIKVDRYFYISGYNSPAFEVVTAYDITRNESIKSFYLRSDLATIYDQTQAKLSTEMPNLKITYSLMHLISPSVSWTTIKKAKQSGVTFKDLGMTSQKSVEDFCLTGEVRREVSVLHNKFHHHMVGQSIKSITLRCINVGLVSIFDTIVLESDLTPEELIDSTSDGRLGISGELNSLGYMQDRVLYSKSQPDEGHSCHLHLGCDSPTKAGLNSVTLRYHSTY